MKKSLTNVNNAGYTIIELIVVIAGLVILLVFGTVIGLIIMALLRYISG